MALGTKNRQAQAAAACKRHLRQLPAVQLPLVEEFIREVEGDRGDEQSADLTTWSRRFSDERQAEAAMLERAEQTFREWLQPPGSLSNHG